MSRFPSGLQYCISSKCMSQSQPGLQDYSTMPVSQTGLQDYSAMSQSQTGLEEYSILSQLN